MKKFVFTSTMLGHSYLKVCLWSMWSPRCAMRWLSIIDYQKWNKVNAVMSEQIIKQNVGVQKSLKSCLHTKIDKLVSY